ncbi:hypothetical protein [Pseudobacteroides cellulosolvens]|uniref:Type II secretion system protein G n=1 Tax=Pseudobacteroides cellulosolvens ATCC 35603 = DSM 2933 TaxID=398512 RepID=A0A0L6JRR6_9FIRM|nr:hypothetical protein [Pseudobacteroides cellulosolvens]KNY28087.1 type II secretion system protein G [Pseudobacteroides cellulosolvens ATCC 35603 = DSM 2933]
MRKTINVAIIFILVVITAAGSYFIYGHLTGRHSDNDIMHKLVEKITGKKNDCQENVKMLQAAANKYRAENGRYPLQIEMLSGKYVKEIPKCPGGNGYSIDAEGIVFEDPEKR